MSDDASTTFLRQRRDLFVISTILLLIPIAEIKIADSISMQQFGISMKIGKPEVITYSLWALWFYWYLRYFQAYQSLGRKYLSERYNSIISSYLYSTFFKIAEGSKAEVVKESEALAKTGTSCNFSFKEQKYRLLHSEYTCEYSAYSPTKGSNETVNKILIYREFKYHLIQIKALIKCCINYIEVTEYLLPYIFGMLPLIYLLFTLF